MLGLKLIYVNKMGLQLAVLCLAVIMSSDTMDSFDSLPIVV